MSNFNFKVGDKITADKHSSNWHTVIAIGKKYFITESSYGTEMMWVITDGWELFEPSKQVEQPVQPLPINDISLRDYFAAKAMQGMLSAQSHEQSAGFVLDVHKGLPKEAFNFADAMLKERDVK